MKRDQAVLELVVLLRDRGHVRYPLARERCAHQSPYNKGWEIRFRLKNLEEVARAQRLIEAAGWRVAKPYAHGSTWRLPLYGKEPVMVLLSRVRGVTINADHLVPDRREPCPSCRSRAAS